MIIDKYKKKQKHYQKDQQPRKTFNTLYRKPFQDNVIDKCEIEPLCNIYIKYLDETKNEPFL